MKDFFKKDPSKESGRVSKAIGTMGKIGLHAVKFTALLYTSAHGILAGLAYAGDNGWVQAAQVIGLVTTSATALSIWFAWHNQKITGSYQSIVAGLVWLGCIGMEALAVLIDSQMHTSGGINPNLLWYFEWGLPLSPIFALVGAVLISELDPEQLRARRQANERDDFTEMEFDAHMTAQRVRMESQKLLANVQLNAQESAAKQIASWAQSPEAQEALTRAAQQNAPALFRSIGVPLNQEHIPPEAEVIVLDPDPSSVAYPPPPPPMPPEDDPSPSTSSGQDEEKLAEPKLDGGSENTQAPLPVTPSLRSTQHSELSTQHSPNGSTGRPLV